MDQHLQTYDAWIAHFDLLGFKNKIRTLPIPVLMNEVRGIVDDLRGEAEEFADKVESLFYADTFIFYSKSNEDRKYPGLLHAATHFMQKCLTKGVALRGAIAYGEIAVSTDKRVLLGSAFLDSHRCGEDQNWLGLILTTTAADRLKEIGLDPASHGFAYVNIPKRESLPRRKSSDATLKAFAYTFCRGLANFPCPLLSRIREMQHFSPEEDTIKYDHTVQFLEKHWRMFKQ